MRLLHISFRLPCLPVQNRRGYNHDLTMIYPGEIPVNSVAIQVRMSKVDEGGAEGAYLVKQPI